MVDSSFLENVRAVCRAFEASKGETSLFALLKMDEITDKWTIVVSAAWVADFTFDELFSELRQLLIDQVGDEMKSIARIGIFTPDNHLTELMLQRFSTGDTINTEERINGNIVHEGYIIKAVRPA